MARCTVLCFNGQLIKVEMGNSHLENSDEDDSVEIKEEMDDEVQEDSQQENRSELVFSLNCLHENDDSEPGIYIKHEPQDDSNITNSESESSEMFLPQKHSKIHEQILPNYSEPSSVENSESSNSYSSTLEVIDSKNEENTAPQNSQNSWSSKSCSSNEPEVIDIDDIPDLIQKPDKNDPQPELSLSSKSAISLASVKNNQLSSDLSFVPRNVFEGKHNFHIKFRQSKPSDKSPSSIYCELTKKLYVAKHQLFEVLVCAQSVPSGAVIRVCAVFSNLDYLNEVVLRCPTHMQIDFLTGRSECEHLVQCMSPSSVYSNINGVRSVTVPYEAPQVGVSYTSYIFKLTCFSSCLGGVNRRPFQLLFTLEKDGIALGRYAVDTRVCACPVRDARNEIERKVPNHKDIPLYDDIEIPEEQNYSITVTDPMLYQFLKEMKVLYETSSVVKKLKKNEK